MCPIACLVLTAQGLAVGQVTAQLLLTPEALYRQACAACHSIDGRGAAADALTFTTPVPDFTDCSFATREPDADWMAVVHDGGPIRGFAATMPAFGDALSLEDIRKTLGYVRGFCPDDSWPRGELNLPRPLVTEKAYPEDEAVLTTSVALEGAGAVANEVVYEKRIGAQQQLEIAVPVAFSEHAPGSWTGGLGDVAVGIKRVLFHAVQTGTIVSAAAELVLPTGDEDRGLGRGVTVVEPFVAMGQLLPRDVFLHVQSGLEIPTSRRRHVEAVVPTAATAETRLVEAFWRVVAGRTITQGQWGRAWSPMIELLGARELTTGERVHWDVLPQLQVTLNTRQHVLANVGVRVPLTDAGPRNTTVLVYLLWDWFDGGFFQGW